jgi:hypothetical protein
MELCSPDQLTQRLGSSDELWGGPRRDRRIGPQVVEIKGFTDRPDQRGQPVLLELGHVGLAGERRDVDAQSLCDSRHQIRAGRLVPGLDLGEQAVRIGDPLSQPALSQARPFPVMCDPSARVFVAGERHACLPFVTHSTETLPARPWQTTVNGDLGPDRAGVCG